MIEPISKHIHNNEYIENHTRWRNESLAWLRSSGTTAYEQKSFFSKDHYGALWFAVIEDGLPIGTVGLTSINKHHKTAEFSLLIGSEHRKKGYGSKALKDLIQYGFKELGLELIFGETFIYPYEAKKYLDDMNVSYIDHRGLINPGVKAYEKLGFRKDAVLRNRYRKYGFTLHSVIYSIMPGELK